MKKLFFLFSSLLLLPLLLISQSSFDTKLQELADNVALQIGQKGKAKVAVWHFVNTQGEITDMGRYIAEDFSVYITNASKEGYQVMDRNHLDQILKEHKLNAEGFIDSETAKQLGRLNAVDAIITGTVDILETQLKVRVKVLDTETALQIAAEIGYLPVDQNIAAFLGVPGLGSSGQSTTNTNRGFNRPLSSNEQVNNPETVNSECEVENTGDYCFANNTQYRLYVSIESKDDFGPNLTLDPGQTQCIYRKGSGVYKYEATNKEYNGYLSRGEFLIEKCKSVTFTLK